MNYLTIVRSGRFGPPYTPSIRPSGEILQLMQSNSVYPLKLVLMPLMEYAVAGPILTFV